MFFRVSLRAKYRNLVSELNPEKFKKILTSYIVKMSEHFEKNQFELKFHSGFQETLFRKFVCSKVFCLYTESHQSF